MTDQTTDQGIIHWDFEIVEQNHVSRYGHTSNEFWKQYLPAGVAFPKKHPPKRISPRLYDLAKIAAQKG